MKINNIGVLALAAIAMIPMACNMKAKECNELTKDGRTSCTAKDAIKGKICLWQNDTCVEKPSHQKDCSALTKAGQDACTAHDAVPGKVCLWQNSACVEKPSTVPQ